MEDGAIQVDVSRQEIMDEMRAERAGSAPEEQPKEQAIEDHPEEQAVEEQPEIEEQPTEEEGIDFYTPDGRTIRVPKSARYKAKLDGRSRGRH